MKVAGRAQGILGLGAAVSLILAGFAAPAGAADSCANDAMRAQQNAGFLPSCRGFEKVSPDNKNGSDVTSYGGLLSSVDGNRMAYGSTGAFGDAGSAPYQVTYIGSRSGSGWSAHSISPPNDPVFSISLAGAVLAYTDDLSKDVTTSTHPLVPGAPPSTYSPNYYVRDNTNDSYQLISTNGQVNTFGAGNDFEYTPDFGRIVFNSDGVLVGEAPTGKQAVYSFSGGSLELASHLPDGSVAVNDSWIGAFPMNQAGTKRNALSRDGSRLFFSTVYPGKTTSSLFMRSGGVTTDISLSQAGLPDPSGPRDKDFVGASDDGSRVFFLSCEKLTDDSTASFEAEGSICKRDLYMYETDSGVLNDLTTTDPDGADVISAVQISDDGDVVYLVAGGELDEGAGSPGEPKIYVWRGGDPEYIATISSSDFQTIYPFNGSKATPDGHAFAFTTRAPQPGGFDNLGTSQIYLYRLGGSTTCISCDPGVVPADAIFGETSSVGPRQSRNLSYDGRRVFFETAMPLSGADSNGQRDVYGWEDGSVALLSGGQSDRASTFAEASPSGNDVFFVTRQRLLPSDTDDLLDLYDARVGGGFAEPPAALAPCLGSACQSIGAPPASLPVPATETVSGRGNASAKRCGKNKRRVVVKRKVRCVKKKPASKRRGASR